MRVVCEWVSLRVLVNVAVTSFDVVKKMMEMNRIG